MENPLKLERRSQNLSIRDLAGKARVSKSLVLGNEAALYPNPSQRIVETLFGEPSSLLYESYDAFRSHKRAELGLFYFSKEVVELFEDFHKGGVANGKLSFFSRFGSHPLHLLLENRSLTSIQNAFCLSNSTFYLWKRNPRRVGGIPGAFEAALRETNYSEEFISGLTRYNEEFKSRI